MNTEVRQTVPKIKVSDVITLLKQGYTRFATDDMGFGSIEARYGLSQAAVRRLFQNERLKGLKTMAPEFELIDDVEDEEPQVISDLRERVEMVQKELQSTKVFE